MKNQRSFSRAMTLEENENAVDAQLTTKSSALNENNDFIVKRRNKPTAARSRSMPIAVHTAMNG
jgi:hypothetical protein